jgi:hypothetical protein
MKIQPLVFLVIAGGLWNCLACSSSHNHISVTDKAAKGWKLIYVDSVFENGKLSSLSVDTVRFEEVREFEGRPAIVFSNGNTWIESGDTVFQISRGRGGEFLSPLYIFSEKPAEFNFVFGGDVVMNRKVEKLGVCEFELADTYTCYRFTDQCGNYSIVARGLGIIRELRFDCNQPETYSSKTLLAVSE